MSIINWLKGKLENEVKKDTNSIISRSLTPTIKVYHPKGCSDYATFLMKNLDSMDAKLEKVEETVWHDNDVVIRVSFQIPYLIHKAYEISSQDKTWPTTRTTA